MKTSGIVIQALAGIMLVVGIALSGYALTQPEGNSTTYTLTVTEIQGDAPGSESDSITYSDLKTDARKAFARAKLDGQYATPEEPPSQLENHKFVRDGGQIYELNVSETDRITMRMVTLFGGTMTALIGGFVSVSWIDVGPQS
jgi:hypothetical protein